MKKRIAIKNHAQEIQLITRRCIAVLVIMIILISFLVARLAYLQLHQNDLYVTLSKKNWLDLVPLEPTRGLIYDRNGVLLAENIPVFSLDILPFKVENFPKMLSEISKIIPLSDYDIAQFQKQLKQHRRFDQITLKMRLSESEVAKFSENQYRFPGAMVRARLMRHYPEGAVYSHVLGYVGRINIQELDEIDPTNYSATNYIGKLGIEKFYEDELHGSVGYEQAENDASGEPVRVINQINPIPGKNIYLTIDSQLQKVAEQALAGHRGAIVVLQPSTGQVLALVSEPTFDPNVFVAGINPKDYQTLQAAADRPLFNRALRGVYPLASTIKPYMALEGLDSGVTTPSYTIFDPGWFQLPNSEHVFYDWRHHGHGQVNLKKAVVSSCDTYFYQLGNKMGIKRIDDIMKKFGFGEATGIDLNEELPGIIASPEWKRRVKGVAWYPGDTINSVIGQGFMQATPLQLANAVATIANRGKHMTPYLMLGAQDPGKNYEPQTPTLDSIVELNDKNYWEFVIDAMQGVTHSSEGTAYYKFSNTPYTIAGKTGTAQVHAKKHLPNEDDHENQDAMPEKLRDNSLFIAFAPVDNPEIAIAVIVENAKLAVTVSKTILDYYLIKPISKPITSTPVTTPAAGVDIAPTVRPMKLQE